jgi:DNA-binding HxlR family transcriptional regulator
MGSQAPSRRRATRRATWYTDGMDTVQRPPSAQAQSTEPATTGSTRPLGHAIRMLGDGWILLIVMNLLPGPKRFGELRHAVDNINSRTLSQRLKVLEDIGFVERRAFAEIPPRVEYRLTEKGLALGSVIDSIEQFAQRYLSETPPPCPDEGEGA